MHMRTGQGSSRGEEERQKGVRHSAVPTQYTYREHTQHAHTHRTHAKVFIGESFIHSRRLQRLLTANLCAELAACSGPPTWSMHLHVCRAVYVQSPCCTNKRAELEQNSLQECRKRTYFLCRLCRVLRAADLDLDTETLLVHCQGFIWLALVVRHRSNAA